MPTTALWAYRIGPARAKRLLLTGDSITGTEAVEWGLATEAAPADELDGRFEALLGAGRAPAREPARHAQAARQPGPARAGARRQTQALGTFFDGIARHTPEGFAFQRRAAEAGFKQAVRERDEPFGDLGLGAASAASR